ncbi:MAG: ABC transporter ATP-binding protein [Clostridia bacterium]|nr:ABC transporter ATP-binding protein [Clostridia bacterium]
MRAGGLKKAYGEQVIFGGQDFEFPEGKITCLFGRSGVGKTTLLKILGGLTDYDGQIEGRKKAAFVFQEPRLIAHMSVYENIRFVVGMSANIDEMLARLGLKELREKRAGELSGGEAQRVALARALLFDAPLLLLDEPFSSLDEETGNRARAAVLEVCKAGKKTAVIALHDEAEAVGLGEVERIFLPVLSK